MKSLLTLSTILIICAAPYTQNWADEHGAVHIVLPTGEEETEDGSENCGDMCEEVSPWYHGQRYVAPYGDNDDPTDELQEETQWPGEREEFSDILLR